MNQENVPQTSPPPFINTSSYEKKPSVIPIKRVSELQTKREQLPEEQLTVEDVLNGLQKDKTVSLGSPFPLQVRSLPKGLQNSKFELISEQVRVQLVFDFFEYEKCFFFNQFEATIYEEEKKQGDKLYSLTKSEKWKKEILQHSQNPDSVSSLRKVALKILDL